MRKVLNYLSALLILFSGALAYAFVFDCEPISTEHQYELEKEVFLHNNDNFNLEFPSFGTWLNGKEASEARMHEWMKNVATEVGYEAASTFDPWYQDTREGHVATAPENWARGERD